MKLSKAKLILKSALQGEEVPLFTLLQATAIVFNKQKEHR